MAVASCKESETSYSDSTDNVRNGSGRRNTAKCAKKVYHKLEDKAETVYQFVHKHQILLNLENYTSHSTTEFEELYSMCASAMELSMDPYSISKRCKNIKKKMEMSVFTPNHAVHIFTGFERRKQRLYWSGQLSTEFSTSLGTLYNYLRHVAYVLHAISKMNQILQIVFPNRTDGKSVGNLSCGFLQCVAFVNGTKPKIFRRPCNDEEQEDTYRRPHSFNCHSVLV